ncbi:hypothetical protein KRP22_014378 [Phytophthora ramorum]|nr:hypothetical protein KRP22_9018 [Phytophthora ramorum]
MRRSLDDNAPPSPPCSSTYTLSLLTPSHPIESYVSPASIEGSPTSGRGQEPSHSPVSKTVTPKRTPKSRRHRNRPIHEITRLKQQIPVLESEIRVLWARSDEIQRQELRARAENMELKSRLQRSVTHAKELERKLQLYLQEKQTIEASMLPDLGAVGRNLLFDADRDVQIIRMLSTNVDENYNKLEQVYEAADMDEVQREMEDAKVLATEDGSSLLQVRSIGLQPFKQQIVLRAMWQALENQTVLKDQECTEIGLEMGKASRVIVLKREIVLRGSDAGEVDTPCVSCTIRVVLKKFLEPGREIHVWDAFGVWPRAVSTREYGWGVIMPLDVKEAGDITLVKNVIFMTSTRISADESDGAGAAAQHSVARLYKQIMQDRQRVVENALLDQTRAS